MEIYIHRGGGDPIGPLNLDQIQDLVRKGELTGQELAYHQGFENWVPLSEVLPDENSGKNTFRVWLVFALGWWLGGSILFGQKWERGRFDSGEFGEDIRWHAIAFFLFCWILPPLLVGGIMKAVAWAKII